MNQKVSGRMGSRYLIFMIAGLSVFGSINPADLESWPQWHGADRDNISKDKGLLKEWPKTGPELIWTVSGCGKGYSSIAISGDHLYTAGTIQDRTYIVAFDMDGKLVWKTPNGKKWKAPKRMSWARAYDGARATPTLNNNKVYHLNDLGRLAVLDAKTGSEVWTMNIAQEFEADIPRYGYTESVLIDGNQLICYPGGKKGYVVALDKNTGKTIWASQGFDEPASYCSPILVEDHGIRQIITMSKKTVLGIDADSGKLLWQVNHGNRRGINVATPVYYNGMVCVSSGYGGGTTMVRLKYKDKKISAEKIWENKSLDNHHGGILLLDGYIFGTGHNKKGWYCLDIETGKNVFYNGAGGKGALMVADSMIYFLDEKGTMRLMRPSIKNYGLVSQFEVPKGGSGAHWAHPVVHDGRLYVRHSDKLYAYLIRP